MDKFRLLLSACALAMIATSQCAFADQNDEAQIKALEARFAAAFNAKDADAIMKCYVPDDTLFVFDVVPPRQYAGAAAYRKDWSDFLGTFAGSPKFEMTDLVVSSDGTLGYGHSAQHVTGKDTKGKPVDFVVRVSDVYKKIKGQWLIVMEHVSVPVDFDTGKPDMMSKM